MRQSAWARELYEPEMLATADARTSITYDGKPHSVINFCSYNYLGLANHPEVIAAAHEALRYPRSGALRRADAFRNDRSSPGTGATSAQNFSGAKMPCFSTAVSAARSARFPGCFAKSDVAILDNRSHLSLRDGAILSRCRAEKFEHNDPASLDTALTRQQGPAPARDHRRHLFDGRRFR